jgi:hypothetical protein
MSDTVDEQLPPRTRDVRAKVIDGLECDCDVLEWVGASDDLNHEASFLLHAVKSSLHTRVPEQFDRFKSHFIQQREMSFNRSCDYHQ